MNEQASVRNELQFLEDQMTQSAAQQKRLAQNNEKYLSERKEIADQKMKTEHEFSLVDERLHSQIQAFRDAQKAMNRKSQYEKGIRPLPGLSIRSAGAL